MEILHREGLARVGKFRTAHGWIETPTVMPVINPNLIVIEPQRMKQLGASAIITNAYIIRRSPDLNARATSHGVHSLIGFDGPVMTDSGTFQSHVYGSVEYGNLDMVEFQKSIGSDIGTIRDIFSEPTDSHEKAARAVRETFERVGEVEDTGGMILAGPIQGSVYPDLRARSARLMSGSRAGYLPVGGVVPLLESYRYRDLVSIIMASRLNSDPSKPLHLFGAGHPMFLAMSVLMGIDMFDSASYIKYARDSRFLFPDGTRDLAKMVEFPLWSPIYNRYSIQEFMKLDPESRVREIAWHNLTAIFMEIREIRERIMEQTLWQYVEGKSRSHPALFDAFRWICRHSASTMPFHEISRKSPFHFHDRMSMQQPVARRLLNHAGRIMKSSDEIWILHPDIFSGGDSQDPVLRQVYERTGAQIAFMWNSVPVPLELKDTYPVQQSISSGAASFRIPAAVHNYGNARIITRDELPEILKGEPIRDMDMNQVRAIADFQFDPGIGMRIFDGGSSVRVSRSTGRIRTVSQSGRILATLRPHDGFFTLSMDGARKLIAASGDRFMVTVTGDSAEYNSKGFNVFSKFIISHDPDILAGNETVVCGDDGKPVAVGRAMVSGREMGKYRAGVAVKVNHGSQEVSDNGN